MGAQGTGSERGVSTNSPFQAVLEKRAMRPRLEERGGTVWDGSGLEDARILLEVIQQRQGRGQPGTSLGAALPSLGRGPQTGDSESPCEDSLISQSLSLCFSFLQGSGRGLREQGRGEPGAT